MINVQCISKSRTCISANCQFGRQIWTSSKIKLYGRQIPENKATDPLWLNVLKFRKPDVYIPIIYPQLDRSREKRPEANDSANDQPLTPKLPTNKFLHKIASTIHDLSMTTADFLMKFRPVSRDRSSVQKTADTSAYFTPLESFLMDMVHLRSWNKLTELDETKLTHIEQLKPGQTLTILGGGISGLSLAWFVAHSRPDIKIRLIEQSDRYGGWMRSERIIHNKASTTFEYGPRTLLPSHPGVVIAVQMMKQLEMLDKLEGISKSDPVNAKGLFFNDELIKLPSGLKEFVADGTKNGLFGPRNGLFDGLINGLFNDLFAKSTSNNRDESVESFISRRMNRRISDKLVSAVLRGIYGGDIGQLSARSVSRFSNLHSLQKIHGSSMFSAIMTGESSTPESQERTLLPEFAKSILGVDYSMPEKYRTDNSMFTFNGGIEQFANNLGLELERKFPKSFKVVKDRKITAISPIPNGVEINTNRGKMTASIAISTLPANELSGILDKKAVKASHLCQQIPFTNMAVIDIWFPEREIGKNWFGYLIPKSEDLGNEEGVLGVVFDSAIRKAARPVEARERGPKIEKTSEEGSNPAESNANFPSSLKKDVSISIKSNTESNSGTTLTVMMGGPLWNPELDEKQAISFAIKALEKQLKIDIKPDEFIAKVKLNRNCIAQYTVGHAKRVQEIHKNISSTYKNRLFLSGTSFGRGVGIGDCIVDSLMVSSRFSEQRKLLFVDYYTTMWIRKVYGDEVV